MLSPDTDTVITGAVTVTVREALAEGSTWEVAVIVADPTATPVTEPLLFTLAKVGALDVQVSACETVPPVLVTVPVN